MADTAQPRRRVAVQMALSPSPNMASSSTNPSTPSSGQPRPRAKVDLANISTPPTRPTLRSTPSSLSLSAKNVSSRSSPSVMTASASTPLARIGTFTPRTPGTPIMSPPLRSQSRQEVNPISGGTPSGVLRPRATPTQRAIGAASYAGSPGIKAGAMGPPTTPASRPFTRTESASSIERGRAKVKLPTLPTRIDRSSSRSSAGLKSPPAPQRAEQQSLRGDVKPSALPNSLIVDVSLAMARSASLQPSPALTPPHSAVPSHMFPSIGHVVTQSTASCPSSPLLPETSVASGSRPPHHTKSLPINPRLPHPAHTLLPDSPEVKTVALPILPGVSTPRRSSGSTVLTVLTEDSTGLSLEVNHVNDRPSETQTSSPTTPGDDAPTPSSRDDQETAVKEVIGEDAEEAKINRKIADLEISNASLLAINRALEATKTKQRAEIFKLRRALRESLDGTGLAKPAPTASSSAPRTPMSPMFPISPSMDEFPDLDAIEEEMEVDDPELEGRWEKMQELVSTMIRRGEASVKMVGQETKIAAQRVLDWTEVEVDPDGGAGQGEGEEEEDGDQSRNGMGGELEEGDSREVDTYL